MDPRQPLRHELRAIRNLYCGYRSQRASDLFRFVRTTLQLPRTTYARERGWVDFALGGLPRLEIRLPHGYATERLPANYPTDNLADTVAWLAATRQQLLAAFAPPTPPPTAEAAARLAALRLITPPPPRLAALDEPLRTQHYAVWALTQQLAALARALPYPEACVRVPSHWGTGETRIWLTRGSTSFVIRPPHLTHSVEHAPLARWGVLISEDLEELAYLLALTDWEAWLRTVQAVEALEVAA